MTMAFEENGFFVKQHGRKMRDAIAAFDADFLA